MLHRGQAGFKMYRKKNGNHDAIKLPIMRPRIRVARFSFFRAIRRFSFSGSRGFWIFGMAGSSSAISTCFGNFNSLALPHLWRPALFLPKIGWHSLNLVGLTTAQRLITPESELDGSNSLTMSLSMPTESARQRLAVGDIFRSPLFGEDVAPLPFVANGVDVGDEAAVADVIVLTFRVSLSNWDCCSHSAASLVETSDAKSQVTVGMEATVSDCVSMVAICCCCCEVLGALGIGLVLVVKLVTWKHKLDLKFTCW